MTIHVEKTTGRTAEITWDPQQDDPRGHIARAVESDRLADTLTALGASTIEGLGSDADLVRIARATATMQRELERRLRVMAVALKGSRRSWAELADILCDDESKRSSARAIYNAGLRQSGIYAGLVDENDVTADAPRDPVELAERITQDNNDD